MPKIRTFHNVKLENKYIWFVKKEFFDQESIKGKDPSTISIVDLIVDHNIIRYTHNTRGPAACLVKGRKIEYKSYWVNGIPDSTRNRG